MSSIFDVAKYILAKKGTMTTWKLQKLLYYTQAWSLVWDEKPLFKNKFLAWANGPVCRELYEIHKGMFYISKDALPKGNPDNLNIEQKETVNAVLKSYGKFTGQELSNLTHKEAPWKRARKGLAVGERGEKEISLGSMVEYYSAVYAQLSDN